MNPEHYKLLMNSGDAEADIEEFKQLLTECTHREYWSFCRRMALRHCVYARRSRELDIFAQANPGAVAGASGQTFVVGNPHDKEETIKLG